MREIEYQTISIAIESGEMLRLLDNYEEKAGIILFKKLSVTAQLPR